MCVSNELRYEIKGVVYLFDHIFETDLLRILSRELELDERTINLALTRMVQDSELSYVQGTYSMEGVQ